MKKLILLIVLVSLLTLSMTGCFGNFSLTKKLYQFNGSLGNNFVNTIVMWAMYIVPVYGIAIFVDAVILNLIEFWTGSNPLAMAEGQIERQYYSHNDMEYELVATKNRIDVIGITNPEMQFSFLYDETNASWNMLHEGNVYQMTEGDKFFQPEMLLSLN